MRFFSRSSIATLALLFPLSASPLAFAQGAAQQLPPSTAPTPQPGAPTVQTPVALPLPNVSDPMLVPVPRAPREIATWQEALNLLRSRSTDLRIAVDQVQSAVGQEREALAQALPTINVNGALTQNLITKTTTVPDSYALFDTNNNPIGSPKFDPTKVNLADKNSYRQDPGSGYSNTSPVPNYASGTIQLSQPLLALRAWHQMGTASRITDTSKLSVEDLKRTLALGVANAIVGVVTAERVAELNRSGLQQSLERLDLTVRKQRLGAATGLDVVRAQQDVESARTTLVTGDESLRKSRESLGLVVGIPTEVGVVRNIRIEGLERDAVNQCRPTRDVETRADILAAKEKVTVADRNVDDVWLQFAPTINATSTVAYTSQPVFASQPTTWNIMGVLTIPLWDGGNRYGELRDFRAQADEARQNLESSRRNALIQVEQAQRAVSVAADQLKVADRARALALQNDTLTQTAYREGQVLITSLDLVTAAAARRQAEITYALDEFNLVQARVAAMLALANCAW